MTVRVFMAFLRVVKLDDDRECSTEKPLVRHAEMAVARAEAEITVVKLQVTVLEVTVTVLKVLMTVLEVSGQCWKCW